MTQPRFKIDFNRRSSVFPITLFYLKRWRFARYSWEELEPFKTIEEAKAHYDKIKDLPEYLP